MFSGMKKIIKIIFGLVFVAVLGFFGLVGYATLSDYRPDPATPVFEKHNARAIADKKDFKLLIWNLGYGGLSEDMDFFYDGGKQVKPVKKIVTQNLSVIEAFIASQKDIDFFLFQEVDQKSRRSYAMDEYSKIAGIFPGFHSSFGKNYDVFFVPIPPLNPLGSVLSGLQTLARFEPSLVTRYSFPGNYKWPMGLFMLDRCFLVSRYTLDTGKQLLVINTHNSAYVTDSVLRIKELNILKDKMVEEYSKGNFVVAGGDWNANPPGFKPENIFFVFPGKNVFPKSLRPNIHPMASTMMYGV